MAAVMVDDDEEDPPFEISHKDGVGRCLVATRTLEPLDLILTDYPAAIGPEGGKNDSGGALQVCLSCYLPVSADERCPTCRLPICSVGREECQESSIHAQNECRLFAERGITLDDASSILPCILPLRVLLLRDRDPNLYQKLTELLDHNEIRRTRDPATWEAYQTNVVSFLRDRCGLADLASEDELNRCIGIIRTNGIGTKEVPSSAAARKVASARCLFPVISLLSHACVCNARCVQLSGHAIAVRAQERIEKGQEITISYTSIVCGSRKSRRLLRDNWCFECRCRRCASADECGSGLNAFSCGLCGDKGRVLPKDPLDFASDFACERCGDGSGLSGNDVDRLEERWEAALETDDSRGGEVIARNERFLQGMSDDGLHPSHYLAMRCKSQLISHYGNIPGSFHHQLTEEQLARKLWLCRDFLRVLTPVDPGLTDWRGSTLYEMATCAVSLAQRRLQAGTVTVAEFRAEVSSAIEALEDAARMLEVEEEGTHAEELGQRARTTRVELKEIDRFAEFLV